MTVYSNIQFVKSGPKILAGPSPPLNWTKSKRTAPFFGRPSPRVPSVLIISFSPLSKADSGVSHKKVLHLFWLENLLLNIKLEPSHYDLESTVFFSNHSQTSMLPQLTSPSETLHKTSPSTNLKVISPVKNLDKVCPSCCARTMPITSE